MIKLKRWDGLDNYCIAYENIGASEHCDIVDLVKYADHYNADLTTECKGCKVALNRFFKALENIAEYRGWHENIQECCANGYMADKSTVWESGESVYTGDYSWGVEEIGENEWYIFLNLKKIK